MDDVAWVKVESPPGERSEQILCAAGAKFGDFTVLCNDCCKGLRVLQNAPQRTAGLSRPTSYIYGTSESLRPSYIYI